MSGSNYEDFWNTSLSSSFNFDDEEEETPQQDYVFTSSLIKSSVLSIHSIISKTSLDLILDDLKSTHEIVVPPVEEVIRKMIIGQKYSLEVYKKFSDKMLLLDSALESMDGNLILNVILFIKSTLKQNIFFGELSKRKVAIRHYANYLMVKNQYSELADLYMATGLSNNMKQLYYMIGRDIKCKDTLLKRLETFTTEHLQRVNNNDDKVEIFENSQFLQWQVERKQNCDSIIGQLALLCKTEWEQNKNSADAILEFKKRLKIDDFAFEWTAINVLSSMKMWPQLNELFMKPSWLTKKTSLKTVIPPERFVYGLSRHNAPKEILELYLPCIPDIERSLYLAQKMNCHKFVIQHHIKERDRFALLVYKSKVSPQDEEYFMIENALLTNDKKWKN